MIEYGSVPIPEISDDLMSFSFNEGRRYVIFDNGGSIVGLYRKKSDAERRHSLEFLALPIAEIKRYHGGYYLSFGILFPPFR